MFPRKITEHFYLTLKNEYECDNEFSSFHNFEHRSLMTIENQKDKKKFLHIVLEQLKSNPTWFDIICIPYIISTPKTATEMDGRFDMLVTFYIKYLMKYIREEKLNKIDEHRY